MLALLPLLQGAELQPLREPWTVHLQAECGFLFYFWSSAIHFLPRTWTGVLLRCKAQIELSVTIYFSFSHFRKGIYICKGCTQLKTVALTTLALEQNFRERWGYVRELSLYYNTSVTHVQIPALLKEEQWSILAVLDFESNPHRAG